MKQPSQIDPCRLYSIHELAGIFNVHYRTALRWVKLGEIDAVQIGRTYRILGERIQHRLEQKYQLY